MLKTNEPKQLRSYSQREKGCSESERIWSNVETNVKDTQTRKDVKDFGAMICAISRNNPMRAAGAISRWLQNEENKIVSDSVKELVFRPRKFAAQTKLVMEGIRTSIQLHTSGRGTRTIAGEKVVKNSPNIRSTGDCAGSSSP